ncbi:MAG: phosphoribosylglycinamide formyltransferase [Anaerolineae bacterium]|nr:phosphoribosylglycinamide formyltransferase [Anaerolineae bacterium]
MHRIAVLISGSGTNLQAIIDAVEQGQLPGVEIAVVISNRREAYGLRRAIQHGIPVIYFPLLPYSKKRKPRSEYDETLAGITRLFGADYIVLAGWMHIFTRAFLNCYPDRILNLHPALPGAFPGANAIEEAYQAFQNGEIEHTGVMLHLVPDEQVDAGPVLMTVDVPIYPTDSLADLEQRIHTAEHKLLVKGIGMLVKGN